MKSYNPAPRHEDGLRRCCELSWSAEHVDGSSPAVQGATDLRSLPGQVPPHPSCLLKGFTLMRSYSGQMQNLSH